MATRSRVNLVRSGLPFGGQARRRICYGAAVTPHEFIRKWKAHALTERASAQEHFIDICRLVGHPTPAEADPAGEFFTFEKGVPKTGGGGGFADVWKKGFFAWEYKKRRRDLDEALVQLVRYAASLDNPPLQVVCDTIRFKIVTAWTNVETKTYAFEIEDLVDPEKLGWLHAVLHDPEKLKPARTRAKLTVDAAEKFQTISKRLQGRYADRGEDVAHFVNQLVFCFFADSVKLLPEGLLRKLLRTAQKRPDRSKQYLDKLFEQMETGGEFDLTDIAWFNGGLFDGRRALPLDADELILLDELARLFDWSLIDPTIFGTLFERFLDPDKRAQIGAHYTNADKIMQIVEPVLLRPLRQEWEDAKAQIATLVSPEGRRKLNLAKAAAVRDAYIDRLASLRILDPACGSGNFLYLALQGVKDLEHRAINDAETFGILPVPRRIGPEILHGIEINPFAAELARTTIWIGHIQWSIKNAVYARPEPILQKLDAIECRDALLRRGNDGVWREQIWPAADVIIGNPPFLGGKKLRGGLGNGTVGALFDVYDGRVPRQADLVCYWFVKAWQAVNAGQAQRVGLVSTNSIRGGANRKVLDPIAAAGAIFEAWSDEPWVVDGAAVRVSLVCFEGGGPANPHPEKPASAGVSKDENIPASFETQPAAAPQDEASGLRAQLNGVVVPRVNADLTGAGDLTRAQRLKEDAGVAFQGIITRGPFDVSCTLARSWLEEPNNPNGRANKEVLYPIANGADITRRARDTWVIDFTSLTLQDAALFQMPFEQIKHSALAFRQKAKDKEALDAWWTLWRSRPEYRKLAKYLSRQIFTPRVAKHRLFVFVANQVLPDDALIAIARDDDTTFGILHSRFHEAWALRLGTWLGVGNDPRYTPTTTFETFPFPEGLTPNIPAADYATDPRAHRIAAAAKALDEHRNRWLNPPDLVEIVPEVVPGYPDRILPRDAEAALKLKERTLTKLYNERPHWLANLHDALDRAVAAAYGWPEDIAIEEALANLLAENLRRAATQREAQ